MPDYLLRVELTVPVLANYSKLRIKLVAAGFTKIIVSKDNIKYQLPNGNYLAKTDMTIDEVYNVARSIVLKQDIDACILLVLADKFMWENLPKG